MPYIPHNIFASIFPWSKKKDGRQKTEKARIFASAEKSLQNLLFTVINTAMPRWAGGALRAGEQEKLWSSAREPVKGFFPTVCTKLGYCDGTQVPQAKDLPSGSLEAAMQKALDNSMQAVKAQLPRLFKALMWRTARLLKEKAKQKGKKAFARVGLGKASKKEDASAARTSANAPVAPVTGETYALHYEKLFALMNQCASALKHPPLTSAEKAKIIATLETIARTYVHDVCKGLGYIKTSGKENVRTREAVQEAAVQVPQNLTKTGVEVAQQRAMNIFPTLPTLPNVPVKSTVAPPKDGKMQPQTMPAAEVQKAAHTEKPQGVNVGGALYVVQSDGSYGQID